VSFCSQPAAVELAGLLVAAAALAEINDDT
jgi:hypothetical protein